MYKSQTQPQEIIRAAFDTSRKARQVGHARREYIDDAVNGAGAVHGRTRPAQYLDGAGLLIVELEHLVEIAEPDRADWQVVFRDQEGAAGPGTGEHRRTDATQALGSAAALYVDAGNLVQCLGLVLRAE